MYVGAYETSSSYKFYNMRFLVMFITAVCLLFLLKLKWPKNKSVYDVVVNYQLSRQHNEHRKHETNANHTREPQKQRNIQLGSQGLFVIDEGHIEERYWERKWIRSGNDASHTTQSS